MLVTGGRGLATAELYDPATRTWNAVAPMPRARVSHLAVRLYSGSVMLLGGEDATDATVDLYLRLSRSQSSAEVFTRSP